MGSFTLDLTNFKLKTEQRAEQVCRKIVLQALTLIVTRSPVDTGRFRANNSVSIGSLPSDSSLDVDKSGSATISRGGNVLASLKLGDTMFVYNNVAYALALEYGHSKQAPQGVYRLSLQDVVSQFDALARTAE